MEVVMKIEKSDVKAVRKSVVQTMEKEVHKEPAQHSHQIQEAIRLKAYELYLERGGNDIENWVAAEQLVLKKYRK